MKKRILISLILNMASFLLGILLCYFFLAFQRYQFSNNLSYFQNNIKYYTIFAEKITKNPNMSCSLPKIYSFNFDERVCDNITQEDRNWVHILQLKSFYYDSSGYVFVNTYYEPLHRRGNVFVYKKAHGLHVGDVFHKLGDVLMILNPDRVIVKL